MVKLLQGWWLVAQLLLLVVLDGFVVGPTRADEPQVRRQFDGAGRVLRDQQLDDQGRPMA